MSEYTDTVRTQNILALRALLKQMPPFVQIISEELLHQHHQGHRPGTAGISIPFYNLLL